MSKKQSNPLAQIFKKPEPKRTKVKKGVIGAGIITALGTVLAGALKKSPKP